MNNDPKGYYAILGVHPSASDKLISQAYRVRRGELHPDLNKSPSATRDFQLLEEAMRVLSDPASRAAYDTSAFGPTYAPPSPSPSSSSSANSSTASPTSSPAEDEEVPKRWEPLLCSRCSALSAQPRYRVYYTVASFLWTANKTARRGIFCAKCETKVAARATGLTLLFGWWGFVGFFWTLDALARNLLAAWLHRQEDAKVMACQAMYFAQNGKTDLARALAIEVLELTNRPLKPTKIQRMRERLGYVAPDPLKPFRETMEALLRATPAGKLRLDRPSSFANLTFGIQASLIGVVALTVAGFITANVIEERAAAERRAEAERARLVREGIEREQAAAVAARKAEELRRLEQPLPPTGTVRWYGANRYRTLSEQLPGLRIIAPPGTSYLVKLEDWSTAAPVGLIFVRAGETAEVSVPFGNYRFKLAAGETWYGESIRFGPDTVYSVVDQLADFRMQGDQLLGHELTLTQVRNGNLHLTPTTADRF